MRIAASILATLVTPLLITGCGTENRSNVLGPQTSAVQGESLETESLGARGAWSSRLTQVMFVHASPDAPQVDIYVGPRKAARALGFPDDTGYQSFFSGERRVRVNVAGTSTTVIDATLPFQKRKNYSIFAVDRVANLGALVLEDDLSRPARGKAHVRFVHLSPDAPAVDVAVKGGPVVFGNKSFKQFTPFTPVAAGTYNLEVRVAGTSTVALDLPGVKFKEGGIYTVFARGLLSGSGAQALGAEIIVNSVKPRWEKGDDDDHGQWRAAAPVTE